MAERLYNKMMFSKLISESNLLADCSDCIELGQDDANRSVLSIIRPNIERGFIVSPNMTSEILDRHNLEGARGSVSRNITTGNVYFNVPKCLENDEIFNNSLNKPKVLSYIPRYNIPDVNEFDTIITEGNNPSIQLFLDKDINMIVGYCARTDTEEIETLRALYNTVYQVLFLKNKSGIIAIKDQLKRSKREILVLAKK